MRWLYMSLFPSCTGSTFVCTSGESEGVCLCHYLIIISTFLCRIFFGDWVFIWLVGGWVSMADNLILLFGCSRWQICPIVLRIRAFVYHIIIICEQLLIIDTFKMRRITESWAKQRRCSPKANIASYFMSRCAFQCQVIYNFAFPYKIQVDLFEWKERSHFNGS